MLHVIESRCFSVVLWLSSGFEIEFHLCSLISYHAHQINFYFLVIMMFL
jgi:hypothetical protein